MMKSLKFLFPALLLVCLAPAAIAAPAADKPSEKVVTTDILLMQQAALVVPRDRVSPPCG